MTTSAGASVAGRSMMIPRVFHWIWLGPDPMPPQHADFLQTWQRQHPEWERRVWREEDLPPLHNDEAYRSARSWAQKADVARYEILLRYGGVYLDTDMECVRPLEPAIAGLEAFLGLERRDLMGNAILGCVAGHPWMVGVVEALPEAVRQNWLTLEQTGPAFLTRVTSGRDDVAVFPPPVFYPHPSTAADARGPVAAETIAIHHWGRSWAAAEIAMVRPAAERRLEELLPPGTTCVCVDGGLGLAWSDGRAGVPFVERHGDDYGPPVDDAQALAEVARHRRRGVRWFVVLSTESWWLTHYPGLFSFLHAESEEVVEDRSLIAFRLRSG